MYYEKKWRSLLKSLSWRILSLIGYIIIILVFGGELHLAVKVAVIGFVMGFINYYIHERIWDKIKWGKFKKNGDNKTRNKDIR